MAAAYAALASLMHTIHEIQRHHAPPISLDKQQVQSLTQNITFLQGFLESYNPPVSEDESADPLAVRIADAAYAAEDVIESHIVDTIRPSSSRLILTRLFNFIHPQKKVDEKFNQNLQQAIDEMDLVNKMVVTSIDTAEKAVVVPAASFVVVASSTGPSSRSTIVVVGFKDATLQIMEKLTEDRPDHQVIPIVGMSGIGKTTLARNVYDHKLIKDRFDICAWATISQEYNTREILSEVFSQVTGKDKEQVSEAEIGSELHKCLFGRRFLIVLDDMWSIDAWDNIQCFFPNNQNGSRILVTTRLSELSSQLNNDYSHQMGFLDEASSWDLFSKTVFGEKINICPPELEKIAKKIVDGCRGLPLSIVVVGGLLKKMDATQECWESIGSNLTSVVNLENDKHCLRLMRLSYNHLPVHLKPYFLYMGVFEEDTEIEVSTLVNLWISEGFLKQVNGESLETSGRRFVKELVDRNLLLISKLGCTGNIKSCKIHDLLRELCLKEGQKDGFYHVIGQSIPRGIDIQRRAVIPSFTSKRKALGDLRSMPHARSVICHDGKIHWCRNIGLLRTLHAREPFFSGSKSYWRSFALQCVNLRHLAIKGNISSFLLSAGLLWNLHTIIVKNFTHNLTYTIPEIWKMPQLRHIEFYYNDLCLPDPPSVDDDAMIIMNNIQVLKGVRNFKCCEEVVKRIPNIKKLNIRFNEIMGTNFDGTNFDGFYGISNIRFLCKLESLSVSCVLERCGHLHNLTFPHSLKRLSFYFHTYFKWEGSLLEKMGSLPSLEKLTLFFGFFGTRWKIVEGQFPSLKYLRLSGCMDLEQWTAAKEESCIFPCLQHIHLSELRELKSIPREIGNIPTLQGIRIIDCNEAVVKSAKEMVEEQMELQGDQLPFRVVVDRRVVVDLFARYQNLQQSLSGPNFEVRLQLPRHV